MPLRNPTSIVKQTILLYSFFPNLRLMISRCNWFIGIVFLSTALGTLVSPSPYIAITLLFLLISMILLPTTDKWANRYFDWQTKIGIKRTIVLVSLIIICLIVPQVETNAAIFTSPLENFKNHLRLS